MRKLPVSSNSSNGLCPEAIAFKQDLIVLLNNQEILTSLDKSAMELLVNTFDLYIKSKERVHKEGLTIISPRGELKNHPCVKTMMDAQVQLDKLMDKFGLNPKARKEIHKPKEREFKLSPIDVFLKNQREVR